MITTRPFNFHYVKLHPGGIKGIFDDTLVGDDRTETKLDVLILATGYRTRDYLDPLKVVGKDAVHVNLWKDDKPSAYLGIMTHSAPNNFILLGPNTFLGHNTVVYMIECQVNYIVQLIEKMMAANIRIMRPRKEAEKKYMDELSGALRKLVFSTGNCDAWYSDARGNVDLAIHLLVILVENLQC